MTLIRAYEVAAAHDAKVGSWRLRSGSVGFLRSRIDRGEPGQNPVRRFLQGNHAAERRRANARKSRDAFQDRSMMR
jgi:hypothetical protein